jgi:endonuclease YncB( thermonuclease family)
MKTRQLLSFLCASPLIIPLASGCIFLKAPEPAIPPPKPKPIPAVIFDPADGITRGVAENDPTQPAIDLTVVPQPGAPAPAPIKPHAFRLAEARSGDTVVLQTLKKVKRADGKETFELGPPDTNNPYRLAGIIAPPATSPGGANSIATLFQWAAGQDLDVDLDQKYPADMNGRRLIHVFFKGRPGKDGKPGAFEGKTLSLNRMMVRSGYAIVDLYSPTSFDQKQWLLDEAYAREKRAGLWKTNAFPLLQQRLPSTGTGRRAKIDVQVQTPASAPAPAGDPAAPPATP